MSTCNSYLILFFFQIESYKSAESLRGQKNTPFSYRFDTVLNREWDLEYDAVYIMFNPTCCDTNYGFELHFEMINQ